MAEQFNGLRRKAFVGYYGGNKPSGSGSLGCLGRALVFFLIFFGFGGGNIFMLSGQAAEYPFLVCLAVLCDIAVIGFLIHLATKKVDLRIERQKRELTKQALEYELHYLEKKGEQIKEAATEIHLVDAIVQLLALCDNTSGIALRKQYNSCVNSRNSDVLVRLKSDVPLNEFESFPSSISDLPQYFHSLSKRSQSLRGSLSQYPTLSSAEIERLYISHTDTIRYLRRNRRKGIHI